MNFERLRGPLFKGLGVLCLLAAVCTLVLNEDQAIGRTGYEVLHNAVRLSDCTPNPALEGHLVYATCRLRFSKSRPLLESLAIGHEDKEAQRANDEAKNYFRLCSGQWGEQQLKNKIVAEARVGDKKVRVEEVTIVGQQARDKWSGEWELIPWRMLDGIGGQERLSWVEWIEVGQVSIEEVAARRGPDVEEAKKGIWWGRVAGGVLAVAGLVLLYLGINHTDPVQPLSLVLLVLGSSLASAVSCWLLVLNQWRFNPALPTVLFLLLPTFLALFGLLARGALSAAHKYLPPEQQLKWFGLGLRNPLTMNVAPAGEPLAATAACDVPAGQTAEEGAYVAVADGQAE